MSYDPYSGFSKSYGGTTFDQDQLRTSTRFSGLFNLSSSVSAENILQLAESPDALGSVADVLASTDKMAWLNEFKSGLENEKKEYQVSAWNSLPTPYRQALLQIGYKEPKVELGLLQKAIGGLVKGFQAIPGSGLIGKAIQYGPGNLLKGFVYASNLIGTAARASTYDIGQGENRFLLRMEKAGDLLKDQGFDLSQQELNSIRNKYVKEFGVQNLEDGLTKFVLESVLKINTTAPEDWTLDTNPWESDATVPVNDDAYRAFIELERSLRKDENLGDSSFLSSWKRTYDGEEYIRPAEQLRQYKKLREAGFVPQAFDFALFLGQGKNIDDYILQNQKDAQGNKIEIGSPEYIEARKLLSGYLGDPVFKSTVDALKSKYAKVSPGRQLADAIFVGNFKDTSLYDTVSGAGDLVYQLVFDPTIVGGKALKVSNVMRKAISATDLPRVTAAIKAIKLAEEAGEDLASPTLNAATQKILRDSQLKQSVNDVLDSASLINDAQNQAASSLKSNFPRLAQEFEERTGLPVDTIRKIFYRGGDGKLYIDKDFFDLPGTPAKDVADSVIEGIDELVKSLNSEAQSISRLIDPAQDPQLAQVADWLIDDLLTVRSQMKRTDFTIFDVKRSKIADRLRVAQVQKTKRWVDRINQAFIEMRDNPDNASDVLNRLKDDLPQGPNIVTALVSEHQRLLSQGGSGLDDYDNILQFINDSYRMFAIGVGTKLYTRGFGRTTVPEKYRILGGGDKSIYYEPVVRSSKLGRDRGVPGLYLAMPEITRGGEFARAFLRRSDEIFDAMGIMKIKHQTIAGRVISKPFRIIGNGLWNLTNHGPSSQIISVVGDEFGKNVEELINVSRMAGFTRQERQDLFYQAVTGKLDVAEGIKRFRFQNPPTAVGALIEALEKQMPEEWRFSPLEPDGTGVSPAGETFLYSNEADKVKTFVDAVKRVVNEYGSFKTSVYMNTPDFQKAWKNFAETVDALNPESIGDETYATLVNLRGYLQNEIISEELFGNMIASRFYLLDHYYNELFQRLGITEELLTDTVYGNGESIIKKLNRYRNRQRYAPAGLDQVKINDQVTSWPVLPVAQYSDQMAIPDTRLLLKHMQNLSILQRTFRWSFGSEFLDTVMGRYWKPITLIRLGFIPRAAGEEMFAFFARDGFNIVPALAARYAGRETRGLVTGLVNKLSQGIAGTGRLFGNLGDGFWQEVANNRLEKEVWEFSFAMQFQKRAEYLKMLREKTQEQLGLDQLRKSDHIQATAAWITASLTRYYRNNIVKMLPQAMKDAMVVVASEKQLGIYRGFEAMQTTLHEASNVLARNAFYQQAIADDLMVISSGVPESRFEDMATREVTARNLRTGDDRRVVVRVGREFVEIDHLSDGDLERLSYWYTQVGNDPIAMEALRSGLRGSLTEGQMYELQDLLARTGFHIAPTGVPEGVSAFWVDPITGELLNVNDEIVKTFGVPMRGLFYDASNPASQTALPGRHLNRVGWVDETLGPLTDVAHRDFVDMLVAYADAKQFNRLVDDDFVTFVDGIDSNLSLQIDESGVAPIITSISYQPEQIPFWFFNYDRSSVVKFIENRISTRIDSEMVEKNAQILNPLLASESAEQIVNDLANRALTQTPGMALSDNGIRSNLSQIVDLYRHGYITKEEISNYLDNVTNAYRTRIDQEAGAEWSEIQAALSQEKPDYETARGLLSLYVGRPEYNPNALDLESLTDDDLLTLTFDDFRNSRLLNSRTNQALSVVQEFQTSVSDVLEENWIAQIDELLKLESGPRVNIEGVSYSLDQEEVYSVSSGYKPFFPDGELYRAVVSDSQWVIDSNGNLVIFANNRWGRSRGATISTTEDLSFALAWSIGSDPTQRRILILDATAIKDSVRGVGADTSELEVAVSPLTESLVVPAGKFKILEVPETIPAMFEARPGAQKILPRELNATRQAILAELRMVAAGAPIESTRFLKYVPLSREGSYYFGNIVDESGREVSELTSELLNALGLDRSAIEMVDGRAKVNLSYGTVINLIKKRGFVGEPATADALLKAQQVSEVASVVASAKDVVEKTRTVFSPKEISALRKHITNSSNRSARFKIRKLDALVKEAGVNVNELPQVLQDVIRFNAEDELSVFIDEEIPGYSDLLELFHDALKQTIKSGDRSKLEMLMFYLQPSNKRLRLVLLDGAPIQMRSMGEIEELIKTAALSGVRNPRYSHQVQAQRRSWMTSGGETRPNLIPDGQNEVFTVVVNDEFMRAFGNIISGVGAQGNIFSPELFNSTLAPQLSESFRSIEGVFNAIIAANPLLDERTKKLLRIYFDGIDTTLVAQTIFNASRSNLVSLFPLSTVAFTNKKDAEMVMDLLQNWNPTSFQTGPDDVLSFNLALGSAVGKVGKPIERNQVPFITHRADPTVVTVTDNSQLQNFGHRVEEAAGEAAPSIDPDEDFAATITNVLMKSFVDKEGSFMHELAIPLFNDDFGVQTMASVAPANLPRGLYAPKEFIADENAVDRFTTKWFERINSAVAALAREPMYLYHFANAYAGAKINMQALRTPGLDDFVASLLPKNVDKDDLQAVWAMIPSDFQRELNTHDDLVQILGNLIQRNQLTEDLPVVEFLLGSRRSADRLIAWMRQEEHIQEAVILDASKRALNDVVPYIDDHRVRSLFQDKYRNVFPFLFAQESFLKRWIRSAMYDPVAIRRAQLLAHGVTNSMWSEEDDYGNKYFVIPGTQSLYELFAKDIPFLNKFLQPIPTSNPKLGFNVRRILPGIPGDFENLPTLSPVAMVPVNAIVRHYPELGPSFEMFTAGYPIDTSGSFITETLRDFVPPNYIRAFTAMANIISGNGELGQKEVTSARIAAQSQLEAEATRIRYEAMQLESEGNIEEALKKFDLADQMAPPPNASERVIEKHLDMVKNWSWRNLFVRAFMGWSFGSTGQNLFAKEGLRKEFIDLMQKMPFDDALAVFYAEHPFDAPYTVFKTEKTVEAPLPRTNAAADWMVANREWIGQHKNAAPWLIPAPKATDEYSARAQNMYIAADLVNYKDLDNWYEDFKYAVGANEYFPLKLKYDVRISQTASASEREKLRGEWRVIADAIKLDNPIFAKRMSENVNDRSLEVLNEMKLVFNLPENQRPDIRDKESLSALTDLYFEYKNNYDSLKGLNTTYARRQREILRNEFFAVGSRLVSVNPETRSFWNSIVLPATDLVSEWEIRQALGD